MDAVEKQRSYLTEGQENEEGLNVRGNRGERRFSGITQSRPSFLISKREAPTLTPLEYRHSQDYSPTELKIREWLFHNTDLAEYYIDYIFRKDLTEEEKRMIDDPRKYPIIQAVNGIVRNDLTRVLDHVAPYDPDSRTEMWDYFNEKRQWLGDAIQYALHHVGTRMGRWLNEVEANAVRMSVADENSEAMQRSRVYSILYRRALNSKVD